MFALVTLSALLFSTGLILTAEASAAERVWDSELRRYVTEDDFKYEEFMTEEDALKTVLPKSQQVRKELIRLTAEKKELIEQRIGWKFPEDSFELYIGQTGDKIDGYAMIHNTIGKYKPMTYMVGVDAKGTCTDVELLVFRDAKGSEVRTKRFNAQYDGKTVTDPIRINKDIINISGATMSVRSMSAGVKRVLVLVDEFYLKPAGLGSDTVASRKSDKGFFTSIFGN
ncbi:MAG: FMN-binding protein [Nitrospirota bacterium]|nr:FMN-binding protein [Nitrospirota bacterium]MDP2382943.1 FMN-binding protein [Nitrospirota bacterium]MDP3598017.1 FMN-binding protein [Nitrospirota bacterium]